MVAKLITDKAINKLHKPKVVFTYVEAGMGHIMPARGVAEAFERKYGHLCQVDKWYIFRDSQYKVVRNYAKMLLNDVKLLHTSRIHPYVEHFSSKLTGKRGSLFFVDLFNCRAKTKAIKEIAQRQPDMFVSTYFSPAHFALIARKKGLIDCPIVQYSPDPYIYNVWDRRIGEQDLFVVNNTKAYHHAIKTGYKQEQVKQVPFVTPHRITTLTKEQLRQKLNLPLDKFTVVLASGGYALGKHFKTTKALINSNLPITIISVCGSNKKALAKLQKIQVPDNITFLPLGYTDNFLDYLQASDLFVGKGGSNTLCECMMCGVPFVVNHFGGILEKITARYYADNCGCGECITNVKGVIKFVKKVLADNNLLQKYIANTLPYHRDDGAEVMADLLFEHLKQKFSHLDSLS